MNHPTNSLVMITVMTIGMMATKTFSTAIFEIVAWYHHKAVVGVMVAENFTVSLMAI